MDTKSMIKSLQKTIEKTETRLMNEMDSPDRDFSDCESMVDVFREISAKLEQLKEYEDLGLTVANIKEIDRLYSEQSKELMEYRKAEKEGLLLRLPCKVGDVVYCLDYHIGIFKSKVVKMHGYCLQEKIEVFIDLEDCNTNSCHCVCYKDFGKTVFFTKSESESKLKELEGSK